MKHKTRLVLLIILALILISSALFTNYQKADIKNITSSENMKIESEIFANNGTIPVLYTCNGEGKQPPLKISGVPASAKSLALLVDDPDAPSGDFVHWMIWNIGPEAVVIENGKAPTGAVEGYTGVGKPGWVAPCPPSGIHHYYFKIYALDNILSIPTSTDKAGLLSAMVSHIVDSAVLVGLYGK